MNCFKRVLRQLLQVSGFLFCLCLPQFFFRLRTVNRNLRVLFVNLLQNLVNLRLNLEVALLLSAIASLDNQVRCCRKNSFSCKAALRHGDSLEYPPDVLPAGIVASADIKTVCIQGTPADSDRADFMALLLILSQCLPAQGCLSKSCRCDYHISFVMLPLP